MKFNNKIISLFFICLATSLFTIDMGIISLSLNEIETYFSTTRSVTVWVITIFSISSAIGIISLGFLSQMFGSKVLYVNGFLVNGVRRYSDGARYEGEFRDSVRHGYGKFYLGDSLIFEGKWEADYFVED